MELAIEPSQDKEVPTEHQPSLCGLWLGKHEYTE